MAQVTQSAQLHHSVEDYLEYVQRRWFAVPTNARDWQNWHPEQQLAFMCDWDIVNDRHAQLARWAAQDVLTTDQEQRWAEIQRLIDANRPILMRMFQEEPAAKIQGS